MEKFGAGWHHIDVMDSHFVPELTFGLPIIRGLKKGSRLPLDVHIMVSNPDLTALDYVRAGADILTFHIEAATHHHRLLQAIRKEGALAGVAINPGTPLSLLQPLYPYLDIINVMTVNPGYGGQSFIEGMLDKIKAIRAALNANNETKHVLIEVDGGINGETGQKVVAAGADVLVAGNFVYNAPDRKIAMATLLALASKNN